MRPAPAPLSTAIPPEITHRCLALRAGGPCQRPAPGPRSAPMQRAMVITVSMQAAFGVRRVEVSVPLVPALLDGSGKYRDATAVAEAARKQHQEFAQMRHAMRLEQKRASYRRRHPEGRAFKSLVRLAVTCDSAEP